MFSGRSLAVCLLFGSVAIAQIYTPLPDAPVGTPYSSFAIPPGCVSGCGSYSVNINSLPPGLTIDNQTGNISGTPTTTGVYSFAVTGLLNFPCGPHNPGCGAIWFYQITVTVAAPVPKALPVAGAPISATALLATVAGLAIIGLLGMGRLRHRA